MNHIHYNQTTPTLTSVKWKLNLILEAYVYSFLNRWMKDSRIGTEAVKVLPKPIHTAYHFIISDSHAITSYSLLKKFSKMIYTLTLRCIKGKKHELLTSDSLFITLSFIYHTQSIETNKIKKKNSLQKTVLI